MCYKCMCPRFAGKFDVVCVPSLIYNPPKKLGTKLSNKMLNLLLLRGKRVLFTSVSVRDFQTNANRCLNVLGCVCEMVSEEGWMEENTV